MHIWIRTEVRDFEKRVGITPEAVTKLIAAGFKITVEESKNRAIPIKDYQNSGANIAAGNSWQTAPKDALIFGLKELPEEINTLKHRHIMFGHAYKGQDGAKQLLGKFKMVVVPYMISSISWIKIIQESLHLDTGLDLLAQLLA